MPESSLMTAAAPRPGRPALRARLRVLLPAAALLVLLGLPLLLAATASAMSERELELRVQEIADQLRCPTCQAISVKDSEASFSRQIRDKVRRMLQEGQSEDDIKAYFVSRYGEWILRAPKKEGLGLVLWLAPGVLILVVGGFIGWRAWRTHRPPSADLPPGGDAGLTPEQRERIARDLERFEEEED